MSGLIPQKQLVQELIAQADIVAQISKSVDLVRRGRSYVGKCPFHQEKTPSFHVLPEKRMFHCFGCGAGGNVIRFMMKHDGVTFTEAVQQLSQEVGVTLELFPAIEPTPLQREQETLFRLCEEATAFFSIVLNDTAQGKEAYHYLQSRGIDQRMIETFELGYALPHWDTLSQHLRSKNFTSEQIEQAGLSVERVEKTGSYDRFRDRIMFPIRNMQGKVVGFGGRTMAPDGQPKYLNTPETRLFHKQRTLYALHRARGAIQQTGSVVLFEGYIDVIKAWSAGIDHGVATLGTAFGDGHIALLKKWCTRVVVCYDGDAAGQAATLKVLAKCAEHRLPAEVVQLPAGMDPDEVLVHEGAERLRERIVQQTISAMTFEMRYVQAQHRATGSMVDDTTSLRIVKDVLPRIARLSTPTEREHYTRELAREVGYSVDSLRQQLNEILMQQASSRDKDIHLWNTMRKMDERSKGVEELPALRPAYEQAERQLLAAMMHSRAVAQAVERDLGAQFYGGPLHAALAAFLYAFYAAGNEPDVHQLIAYLEDDALEALAIAVHVQYPEETYNDEVYAACVQQLCVRHIEIEVEQLKQTQQQLSLKSQPDAWQMAAQVGNEIIALEKQRHQLAQRLASIR